jgi:hypothetical protein
MKKHLGLKVDEQLKKELEEQAKAERRSVSNLVEILLMEGVVHRRKEVQAA